MIDHLLLGCAYSREIWFQGFQLCGWQHLIPHVDDNLMAWWLRSRKAIVKNRQPAFDSLCLLIAPSLWLERNARVFRNQSRSTTGTAIAIVDLGELWCRSKVVDRSKLLGE
jgi:hypothetical protein